MPELITRKIFKEVKSFQKTIPNVSQKKVGLLYSSIDISPSSVGNIYRSRDYLDYCKKYNRTRYKKLTTSQRKRSQGSAEKIKILMHKYIQEYQERQRANSRCTLLTILLFFSLVIIVMLLAKGALLTKLFPAAPLFGHPTNSGKYSLDLFYESTKRN